MIILMVKRLEWSAAGRVVGAHSFEAAFRVHQHKIERQSKYRRCRGRAHLLYKFRRAAPASARRRVNSILMMILAKEKVSACYNGTSVLWDRSAAVCAVKN